MKSMKKNSATSRPHQIDENRLDQIKLSKKTVAIIIISIVLLVLGTVTGINNYFIAYFRCGAKAPIAATNFAASWSYRLPGERGYGPHPFNNKYYCTQAEAEQAGYRHSTLSKDTSD